LSIVYLRIFRKRILRENLANWLATRSCACYNDEYGGHPWPVGAVPDTGLLIQRDGLPPSSPGTGSSLGRTRTKARYGETWRASFLNAPRTWRQVSETRHHQADRNYPLAESARGVSLDNRRMDLGWNWMGSSSRPAIFGRAIGPGMDGSSVHLHSCFCIPCHFTKPFFKRFFCFWFQGLFEFWEPI
jgi:hypothetical protein